MPYPVIYLILAILAVLLLIRIATAPIRFVFKWLLNTVCGFLLLVLLNLLSVWTGLHLSLNWVTAAVVGALGLPGVGLLLVAHWLFV